MRCPRCGNTDKTWFYKGSKGYYCRKCISFSRMLTEEETYSVSLEEISCDAGEYLLKYPLTQKQQEISQQCMDAIRFSDVLLKCVCGAGKTEMVVGTISGFLQERKHVCFAIARRQVVLEVAERLKTYFSFAKVVPVCAGYTKETGGDLVVCTTHQLYRYYKTFDCLILDEPDAFPYRGNEVLHGIAKSACRGHTIYLTATPDAELRKRILQGDLLCLSLNERPHGKPIPVPVIRVMPKPIAFGVLVRWLEEHSEHPRIVFVPSVKGAYRMKRFLKRCGKCFCVTGKTEEKDAVIEGFRKEGNGIMVATTVLERGVTFPDADVVVWNADSGVFDVAGLVQMAGRAGRNFYNPYGDVLFLCMEKSRNAVQCVQDLQEANRSCGV